MFCPAHREWCYLNWCGRCGAKTHRRRMKIIFPEEMFRDFYEPSRSEAQLRRYLASPLATRARQDKEEQLRKLFGV
jgi:hypothetical protein